MPRYQISDTREYQLFFDCPELSIILAAGFKMPTFLTVVDVDLTVAASEAGHTVALVVVLLVDAGGSVLTGRTETNN